ncbi:MAG: hypothetical protein HQ549_04765 [Candidatus Omnitrophica bacterium]|nr:hypothetical protein [Candidatus Omnitrophota bacterium]
MTKMYPKLIFNRTTWKYIFYLWIFIWAFVFCKNLFYKGHLKEYIAIIKRPTLEDKRSFVTGDRLYELIRSAEAKIPENATFEYEGIEEASLSDRRIRYYLYPRLKSDNADYIIRYGQSPARDDVLKRRK